MTIRGMGIKHPKRRGEWAELRFMARASEMRLQLAKPWGETARYDFAVEYEGRFSRVQVKSTMFKDRGGYSCTVRGASGPYADDEFDFLAAYVIPLDIWYIIPAEKIRGGGWARSNSRCSEAADSNLRVRPFSRFSRRGFLVITARSSKSARPLTSTLPPF